MCTAITYNPSNHYFGRTLDVSMSYGEQVVVTPRNYPFVYRKMGAMNSHYAMVGMATVIANYPLYYEAANECGVCIAGLNFPNQAVYYDVRDDKDNITPFELIPWILGQCKDMRQVRELLSKMNLCNISFSEGLPLTTMHWIIADKNEAVTLETTKDGMKVYDNPIGVLTNGPTFDFHMTNLYNYAHLSAEEVPGSFGGVEITPYCKGVGATGLPGDLTSAARFVRAAFVKQNSLSDGSEQQNVSQFFHILGSVEHQRGCLRQKDGTNVIAEYTCCINTDTGVYYYVTYDNHSISAVDMHSCDLQSDKLYCYPLQRQMQVYWHK